MKKIALLILKSFLWLLVANGLVALGFVALNFKSFYLPEYGQGYWWAWGATFSEAPENVLFMVMGIIAFILLVTRFSKGNEKEASNV